MNNFSHLARHVSPILAVVLLATSLHIPIAQAGMIGTDVVVDAARAQHDRDRLRDAPNREDLQTQLLARGVEPAQVLMRIDSLTDEEVQTLAAHMDEMPAGGDGVIGALVFIFVVLLITDLLGLTSVFPFTNQNR